MAGSILKGRFTVENNEDMVVFLIGMRINKWWAVHRWLPVLLAMPGMIAELFKNKEKLGFLSLESFFGLKTTLMVQYWDSAEQLIAYAKQEKHMAAWKRFNQKASKNNAVAVYHETYQVKKGEYECIYVNMPRYGLGKALSPIPVTKQLHSANKRLASVSSPDTKL